MDAKKFIVLFLAVVLFTSANAQANDFSFEKVLDALKNIAPSPSGSQPSYGQPAAEIIYTGSVSDDQFANVISALGNAGEGIVPAPKNEISSVEITLVA